MSKSILCAIDLGHPDVSKHVLERAQNLAKMDGAVLNVISIVPDYGMTIVGAYFEEGTLNKAVKAATQMLHEFVSETLGGDAKVRHIISVGSVYEEVLAAVEKVNADLIVVGAHKPEIKDYILGPNASRIARHANVSVYIVRDNP